MLKSIKGFYRRGKIELIESPGPVSGEARIIVTFLDSHEIDLKSRGITPKRAAELRAQLATFHEEWNSPEMALYDDYDKAKTHH